MNYELALKLKESGFPQTCKDDQVYFEGFTVNRSEKSVCCPTLSELIEACGDDLKTLYKFTDDIWEATGEDCTKDEWEKWDGLRARGSTPEEAVANLWLELQK